MAPGEPVVVRVGSRELPVTNLEKVYWPEDGITKGELIGYYTRIAPVLLPYLKDRPLVLTRYPEGIHGPWFYAKNAPEGRPGWLRTYTYVHPAAGPTEYLLADEPAALTYIANLGAIEIHPWTGRIQAPERPDFAIVDLDPAEGATWEDTREVALLVRQVLDAVGTQGFPKWSGATGIHIYCPCAPDHTYQDTAAFCLAIGRLLARVHPRRVTLERQVRKRRGKVYVDYLQNRLGQTITAVYGVRPRPGAPVSVPVTWEEIARGTVPFVTLRTIWDRLAQVGDLFAPVLELRQDLRRATRQLEGV
ncbi:MAG: non-homologous end-joining DNA ligase [Bacillota bacterium]|nr:MAG: DNA polymerase [Bacillota bacterium]